DVEYGQYSVILLVEGFPPSHAGTITVYEDSQSGTLNDFLTAIDEGDLKPDVVKRFEEMVAQVKRDAASAENAAAGAEQAKNEIDTALAATLKTASHLSEIADEGEEAQRASRDHLGLKSAATMVPQSDIHDRTQGCLAIPG
ncbi:TPA: phage tail protein, partial [Escherichia coli]|nr:phage tail protein [Escherichia coli]